MTEEGLKVREEALKKREAELTKQEEKRILQEKLDRIELLLAEYEASLYLQRPVRKESSLFGEFVETITYPFKGIF
jgi:hypothetical protein